MTVLATALAFLLITGSLAAFAATRARRRAWFTGPLGIVLVELAAGARLLSWANLLGAIVLVAARSYVAAFTVAVLAWLLARFTTVRRPRLPEDVGYDADREIRLRVFTANLLYINPTGGRFIAEEIRATDPDLLVLAEAHPAAIEHMGDALAAYPYRKVRAEGQNYALMLASKLPLHDERLLGLDTIELPFPSATIRLGGQDILVAAVHTAAPVTPAQTRAWYDGLGVLAEAAAAHPGPVLLAGDFNATANHGPFRALRARARLDDVTSSHATWPVNEHPVPVFGAPLPLGPVLGLDHVLVRDLPVVRVRLGVGEGSDHAPIVVDALVTPVQAS